MAALLIDDMPGGVRCLTLSRPRANAFDPALMLCLSDAMEQIAADKNVRAVVVTGAGDYFSNGLDFSALLETLGKDMAGLKRFSDAMKKAFLGVWTCPRPTVAAVNGPAIAAGFLVAAACDFRYVLEGVEKFGLNELAFGAGFPPIAIEIGRYALGRALPPAILGALLFSWEEGLKNGSFHKSFFSQEQLLKCAYEKAARLGKMPQEAYAHVKAQVLLPFLKRVMEQTPEHEKKTFAMYSTDESARAITEHIARITGAGRK